VALHKPAPTNPKPIPRPPDPEPTIDRHGTFKRQIRALALERGVNFLSLLDEFWGRASARWYVGAELEDAEAGAWRDIAERGRAA
jgi:hypothetical protein